jgi:DNA-binding NtrC family response regulator
MSGESRKTTVLVIDDDRMVADTLAEILRLDGFSPVALYSGEEAISFVDRFQPDVILSDIRMHGVDGLQTAQAIRQRHPECRVILFTASPVTAKAKQTIQRSGFEFLQRPLHPNRVLSVLRITQGTGMQDRS